MHRRTVLTASGTVATALLSGCAGYLTDANEPTPEPTPLELLDHRLVRRNEGSETELVKVAGTARSRSDSVIEDVTVKVTFYDDEGTALGGSTAELRELQPGNEWAFGILYSKVGEPARAVADYEIEDETQYPTEQPTSQTTGN